MGVMAGGVVTVGALGWLVGRDKLRWRGRLGMLRRYIGSARAEIVADDGRETRETRGEPMGSIQKLCESRLKGKRRDRRN